MSEPLDSTLIATGGALAAFLARFAWDRWVRRADSDAAQLERARAERSDRHEHQLEAMKTQLVGIQAQLGVLLERLAFNTAEFRRIDERQAGMSQDHGRRLAQLESKLVRLETLFDAGGGHQ